MMYCICFLSYGFLVLLRQGIARGSSPGTTTEVQRIGFPLAENQFVLEDKFRHPNYVSKSICRSFRANLMLLELLYNYHGV
jgi:hypothetical protein